MPQAMLEAVPLFRRRLALSIAILAGTSLVIFVTLAFMFTKLEERQRGAGSQVRESALWATFQADREAYRLTDAILRAQLDRTPETLANVVLRYDVLYSRATDLQKIVRDGLTRSSETLTARIQDTETRILGIAPQIDAVKLDEPAFLAYLPELSVEVDAIRKNTEFVAIEANTLNGEMRVAERAATGDVSRVIAWGVLVLVAGLVLVVALLIIQLVHIARTGRRLQALSQHNARAAEAAEAGNRAKSVFLATMSHEIRTPLNGVIGMAEVLATTPLDGTQADLVGLIHQSGDLLLDVISDILDFSKLEAGMVEVNAADLPLTDLLDQMRGLLSPRATAKGLRLEVCASPVTIRTDPALLRQILVNLIGNAIKFTDRGSVRVLVEAAEGARLRISVTDTGHGIPADALPRLFKEFSQIDNTIARRFDGSGLGLAICKRLVEALGGEIGVFSVCGEGTSFWIEIPTGLSAGAEVTQCPAMVPSAAVPMPAHPQAQPTEPCRYTGRILVVEDNGVNRKVACGLLESLGLRALIAEHGAEACSMTETQTFDLILMDMQMPVLDGLAATRLMRARGYAGTIVGLTANAFVSDREGCLAAGMDDFITKPVTRAKLRDLLGRWLPHRAADVDEALRGALIGTLGADVVTGLLADFGAESLSLIAEARAALGSQDPEPYARAAHAQGGRGEPRAHGDKPPRPDRTRRGPRRSGPARSDRGATARAGGHRHAALRLNGSRPPPCAQRRTPPAT